jgi:hypothetical protein
MNAKGRYRSRKSMARERSRGIRSLALISATLPLGKRMLHFRDLSNALVFAESALDVRNEYDLRGST